MKRFIRELRRREVFRTAGLYVGICWIAIEAASVMLPTFDAPEWVLQWIIIAAVVGFPVMLVLAWTFDITDKGIEVQEEATETVVIPVGRRRMDFVVIGVLAVALVFAVYMNITQEGEYVPPPEPVSVLIADFDNQTGNALFDGLLEQALIFGIEGAPHITAYSRNNALSVANIVQPGATSLDANVARLVAVREGINIVLSGAIIPDGSGFDIELNALDSATGEEVFDISENAKAFDSVLSTVGTISEDIREELGDTTLDQPGATDGPFTAASLEAAKAFTEALELEYEGAPEEAVKRYAVATELDPNFGRAYAGWALSEFRMGNTDKAEELWQKALSLMETMTERERLRTLGVYYATVTGNFESAVQSFTELVEKYPADAAARNNLAVVSTLSLDFQTAFEQGRQIMEIYPNSQLYRSNFALYAMYSSDFEAAAATAQQLITDSPGYGTAYLALAVSSMAAGDFEGARDAYRQMANADTSDHRASVAAQGLADVEAYLGNLVRAREFLTEGIEADMAADNRNAAAAKTIALSEIDASAGAFESAANLASEALALSEQSSVQVAAALVLLAAGQIDKAKDIGAALASKLQPQSRAYGLVIEAAIERDAGNHVQAIDMLRRAVALADLWL
ncbi:MAG: tetratricopeptide repeat protein, partial [Gammaproteobacteria bacterium]|nr:tetratricopeptide repeat protein [Gammaproteobacteria bacterium]